MSEITITQGDLKERRHSTQCMKTIISKSRDTVDKFDLATDDANVDFSVSGIPEEAVKRSENFNILQLIRRITRHPQKQAVQNDLDKEQSFNAFSAESKKAIKESGNIEISEIINAEPKWQCKSCLNHCNPGVIYCVCGRLMTTDSAENRKYISSTLDSFSIANFYIRKDRPRGHRYGKAPGCKEYHTAHQLAKKCRSLREMRICVNSVYTHFPKDRNCEICTRTKITRAPCRRRDGGAVHRAENFGDLITADHKVLSDNCESRNNHRYAVVVQDLATQWNQAYPCKNKTSQETQRSLQKFLEPERKTKVIYTDNSLEFGRACEDLSWNHCTSTPHRSETNGIAERAVRRVTEGTSAVLLQSSLNESWWADSMELLYLSAKRSRSLV